MTLLPIKTVQDAFQEIMEGYSLHPFQISDREVLIVGNSYAIDITLDYDGLNYDYFDREDRRIRGYDLAYFLIQKRTEFLTFEHDDKLYLPLSEYNSYSLRIFVRHLMDGGKDILEGSKNWIRQYNRKAFEPSVNVKAALKMTRG